MRHNNKLDNLKLLCEPTKFFLENWLPITASEYLYKINM